MNAKEQERQGAVRDLQEFIKPGDTIYTNLRHVSRSGMSRVIMPFVIRDNEPRYIGWTVAKALDYPYDRNHEGVKIGGCGMDMGFALIHTLSNVLFRDGFPCLRCSVPEHHCPSNDHYNDPKGKYHWHKSGGYALKHRWF